ncbi:MAG: DUF6340 family protein [Bacteroidales bacterium]|nr:DUF6340 family protein [Bacteroidales bacterium]
MTRSQHTLSGLIAFLLGVGMTACGAMIQIIDVDVKLPAEHLISFEDRTDIAIFNALYDTEEFEEAVWNDSLLVNKVAEGFRNQLATELSLDSESISVFNHFCGQSARGTLDDKEYIYSLSEQTGAQLLVLIDSVKLSDFQHIRQKMPATSEYKPYYISAVWQMVFRFFDVEKDRFVARFVFNDTLFWNVVARDRDSILINRKLELSIPETAEYLGSLVARKTRPQWETQERALFFFPNKTWYKALDHAFMFEWEEAQNVWLSLTKKGKNPKKIAYAAYDLAVALEMMGRIDLAKEWLELASKYQNIREVKHYLQMLEERRQQQGAILLQLE